MEEKWEGRWQKEKALISHFVNEFFFFHYSKRSLTNCIHRKMMPECAERNPAHGCDSGSWRGTGKPRTTARGGSNRCKAVAACVLGQVCCHGTHEQLPCPHLSQRMERLPLCLPSLFCLPADCPCPLPQCLVLFRACCLNVEIFPQSILHTAVQVRIK